MTVRHLELRDAHSKAMYILESAEIQNTKVKKHLLEWKQLFSLRGAPHAHLGDCYLL